VAPKEYIFTSESVSEGHPDKVADQISDAILDAHLSQDKFSRVACETLVKNGTVIIAGEITSAVKVEYEPVIRKVIRSIGYTDPIVGFDADNANIHMFMSQQSHDISIGVNEGEGTYLEQGAGDQGLMFGFACDETEELMPLPIALSHKLMYRLAEIRKSGIEFLKPDAKSQVSVQYSDGKPVSVDTIVLSTQHTEAISLSDLEAFIIENVVKKVIPENLLDKNTKYLINPTGRFVIGGPVGDCGLTGRKIIVDTYGGYSRHGGGAFSGKDPSKVDRSAAYAARYIAKNIVGAGLAKKCEVQIAYAIGVAKPVAVYFNTFDTGIVPEERLSDAVQDMFDLTPRGIIKELNLLMPIYEKTAAYGHFGRLPSQDGYFSWETLGLVPKLKKYF
jgi:S-adenosylmethionine synthetase